MSVLGKMQSAKTVEDRNPFFTDGRHKVAIERYFVFDSKKHGRSIAVEASVIESVRPATPQEIAAGAPAMVPGFAPGTTLFKAWNINRAPRYVGDPCQDDQNEALTFLAKLVGGSENDARQVAQASLDDGPDGPNQMRNPLRGMVIECVAETQPPKVKKDGTLGKPWMSLTWIHNVDAEDVQKIGAMRAHLDAVKPMSRAAAAPAPVAYAPQPPAAPQAAYQYPTAAPAAAYPAAPSAVPAPAGYGYPAAPPAPGYAPAPQAAPGPLAYPPGVLPPGFPQR